MFNWDSTMIPIYIVTKGPENEQKTYSNLPEKYKKDVIFFTGKPLGLPCHEEVIFSGRLPEKRQACLDHAR